MSGVLELYLEAVRRNLLLGVDDGGRLRVHDPLALHRRDDPFLALLGAHWRELVAFLRRRDEALELACRVCVQAAELLHAAGREGGERLRAAGELLTEAVFAYAEGGERAPLEAAAADYLGLARRLAGVAR